MRLFRIVWRAGIDQKRFFWARYFTEKLFVEILEVSRRHEKDTM